MSYDLWINTYDRTVEKTALSMEMLNRGWRICFIEPGAFVMDVEQPFLAGHGPLEDDASLIGWRAEGPAANRLESIIAVENFPALKAVAEDTDDLAGCSLTIGRFDYQTDLSEEYRRRLETDPKAAFRDVLLTARYTISLTTRLGASPFNGNFMEDVWRATAKLTRGHAVDPQTDEEFVGEPTPKLNFFQYWFQKLTTPNI
jgi:hypothetical protein